MITAAVARVHIEELKVQRDRDYARVGEVQAAPYIAALNKLDDSAFRTLIAAGRYENFYFADRTIALATSAIHTRAISVIRAFLESKGFGDIRVLYNKIIARVSDPPPLYAPPCDCPPPLCDASCDNDYDGLHDINPLPDSPVSWTSAIEIPPAWYCARS